MQVVRTFEYTTSCVKQSRFFKIIVELPNQSGLETGAHLKTLLITLGLVFGGKKVWGEIYILLQSIKQYEADLVIHL